jgi:hypothetical protein
MATYVEVEVQLHDEENEIKDNVHRNSLATYAIWLFQMGEHWKQINHERVGK